MTLVEIHREMHLQGYAIESRAPVQRLADCLGYEVTLGRRSSDSARRLHVRRPEPGRTPARRQRAATTSPGRITTDQSASTTPEASPTTTLSARLDLPAQHRQRDVTRRARHCTDLAPVDRRRRHPRPATPRPRAQPAQIAVHVTSRVDAAHELLAHETALRERHREPFEACLLRDGALVGVETLAGNARLDPRPFVRTGVEHRRVDRSRAAPRPRPADRSLRTRRRPASRPQRSALRPRPAAPARPAPRAHATGTSVTSAFTRILKRLSPASSSAPKSRSHTHHQVSASTCTT